MKIKAFTLAEVLITLGIIGIVASLTLPILIQNQQKKQTAVKLKKFYSVMNQALARYYADEGITPESFSFNDNMVHNGEKSLEWYNNTIGKYLISPNQTIANSFYFSVAFADGSGFTSYVSNNNLAYFMYCTQFKYCGPENYDGRTSFLFEMDRGKFRTYGYTNQNRNDMLNGCKNASNKRSRHYCTRLIELDGWEIKDDYPW